VTHKRKSDRKTRRQINDPKFKTKQRLFEKEGDRETKESQTKKLRNKSPRPPSFLTTSHPKPFSEKAKPHKEKMKRQKAKKPDLCSGSFSSVSPQEKPDSGIKKNKESLSTTHKQSRQTAYLQYYQQTYAASQPASQKEKDSLRRQQQQQVV
jgi:hypothetical protein